MSQKLVELKIDESKTVREKIPSSSNQEGQGVPRKKYPLLDPPSSLSSPFPLSPTKINKS